MKGPRRIVTGIADGRSVFLSDGTPPAFHAFAGLPGMAATICWATAPLPVYPVPAAAEGAPPGVSATPGPGETRLLIVQFPPGSAFADPAFDPALLQQEQHRHLPGLAERFDADVDGMHRTDSVDYAIVMAGHITLELDDGATRDLSQGDVVIQGGTRHAWRNQSEAPAVMAFVLIGVS